MTAPIDVRGLADELLREATAQEGRGRASRDLPLPAGGLARSLLALRAGARTDDHDGGSATLLVLRGSVRIVSGSGDVAVGTLHLVALPGDRHHLEADEDAVVLLGRAADDDPTAERRNIGG